MNQAVTIKASTTEIELIKATLKVLMGGITEQEYLTTLTVMGYNGTQHYSMFVAYAVEESIKILSR